MERMLLLILKNSSDSFYKEQPRIIAFGAAFLLHTHSP